MLDGKAGNTEINSSEQGAAPPKIVDRLFDVPQIPRPTDNNPTGRNPNKETFLQNASLPTLPTDAPSAFDAPRTPNRASDNNPTRRNPNTETFLENASLPSLPTDAIEEK